MEKNRAKKTAGSEPKFHVTPRTYDALERFVELIKRDRLTRDVVVRVGGRTVFPPGDVETANLTISPKVLESGCDASPDFPKVWKGGSFIIANETAYNVTVSFPSDIFRDSDGNPISEVNIGKNNKATLRVNEEFDENVKQKLEKIPDDDAGAKRRYFDFSVNCGDGNTGGSPKGNITPPP